MQLSLTSWSGAGLLIMLSVHCSLLTPECSLTMGTIDDESRKTSAYTQSRTEKNTSQTRANHRESDGPD